MDRNALTLLGCSGSLAVVLLAGNAAQADTAAPQAGAFIRPTTPVAPTTDVFVPHTNVQSIAIDLNSDTVGDLAIAKFKCDCPACRVAVVQLLQTGQLSL
jgi:hypothetical protein